MKRIILLLLVLLLAAFPGCTEQPAGTTAPVPELKEPVRAEPGTTPAYIGPMYRLKVCTGSIMPYTEGLSMEIDGTISQYYAYPGKIVEEGEILLELSTEKIQSQIDDLEDTLAEAKKENDYSDRLAQLEIQILEAELRQLQGQQADQKSIDLKKNDIAQKKADLRQTQQLRKLDLEKVQEEIDALKELLDKTVLRAPFSGRIIRGDLSAGQSVSANVPFLYLADDTKLNLTCQFITDETLESAHRVFARIGSTDYDVQVRELDLEEFYAMSAVSSPVRHFDVIGPEEALDAVEAGQFAALCVILDYIDEALIVPTDAIIKENEQTYVYVSENGVKVLRAVTTGASMRGMTQILEGLEEGEDVYVE